MDPWKIATQAVKELPPYLADDELTAQRLYENNKEQLSGVQDAKSVLNKLVEAGQLVKEQRRTRKGGSPIDVYIAVR